VSAARPLFEGEEPDTDAARKTFEVRPPPDMTYPRKRVIGFRAVAAPRRGRGQPSLPGATLDEYFALVPRDRPGSG